jgi:SPP1 family phage portal protein
VSTMQLHGRRMIKTDESEVTIDNVVTILRKALPFHWKNRSEINYLWHYYKGRQPILNRVKLVRPEIANKIVENRADEIVSFKSGYLMGEPLQYVTRGNAESIADAINQLNEYVFAEEKPAKDKELADWFHICGTSFRMVLPDEDGEEDDSPFEIYTLDPRNTFVVYHNGLGNKPVLGVKYVIDEKGVITYSCYSKYEYFEIVESKVVKCEPHILGDIPIIEYPLNLARIGAFELVVPLLDAINLTDSNRIDGVEQFIQALLLFHNVDISSDDYKKLREEGAIKFKDIDPQLKAEVAYLTNSLNQGETQTLVDHMYQTVLTICGMPNRNGGSSTSDTGSAVIMRDGWSDAEARAKNSELMFKKSERRFLKLVLNICRTLVGMDLKVHNIEIRFTRRNYENILQKAQVLDLLLKNGKVHPRLAFEHCGLFVDSDLAYALSAEYVEEQEKKAQELIEKQNQMKGEDGNDPGNNEGNGGADGNPAETRKQSGTAD